MYNNIQQYGNTTAASVPIALCEAWEGGKIKEGGLVCLAAFGCGFTWASALLRWKCFLFSRQHFNNIRIVIEITHLH
ncbi:MAG: 3-oxoacyl-[acyl-carrier-protein] synthase III C-terminal domain-containing protein [Agriterribacter sp.]